MIYNGVNLRDFHVEFMDESAFIAAPSRSYTSTSIPGRNGDLHIASNRYENLTVKATAIIFDEIRRYYGPLAAFLTQDAEYHRLEGFRDADFYRMAAVKEIGAPKLRSFARGGSFTITFDCKPLLYDKGGENAIVYTSTGTILNCFLMASKPLLRVYGWGTFTVGSGTIKIYSDSGDYIDIDCELKDAYHEKNNRNSFLEVTKWPELLPGENTISFPSTITKIEVTPRWASL